MNGGIGSTNPSLAGQTNDPATLLNTLLTSAGNPLAPPPSQLISQGPAVKPTGMSADERAYRTEVAAQNAPIQPGPGVIPASYPVQSPTAVTPPIALPGRGGPLPPPPLVPPSSPGTWNPVTGHIEQPRTTPTLIPGGATPTINPPGPGVITALPPMPQAVKPTVTPPVSLPPLPSENSWLTEKPTTPPVTPTPTRLPSGPPLGGVLQPWDPSTGRLVPIKDVPVFQPPAVTPKTVTPTWDPSTGRLVPIKDVPVFQPPAVTPKTVTPTWDPSTGRLVPSGPTPPPVTPATLAELLRKMRIIR